MENENEKNLLMRTNLQKVVNDDKTDNVSDGQINQIDREFAKRILTLEIRPFPNRFHFKIESLVKSKAIFRIFIGEKRTALTI